MKIVIAGDGKVGQTLVRLLSEQNYDLTVIDSKQNVLDHSVEHYDVMVLRGNCACMDVLKDAGVEEADLLIAATSADEINLLCCMTAHFLNEKIHTIARIRNPEYADQIYAMRKNFALSMTVNPERQAAEEIEKMLRYPGFIKRETFPRGRMEIVELKVGPDSKLINLSLMQLNALVKCHILVCAVLRNGKNITPSGDFIIENGDRLFVTAPTDNLTTLLKNIGIIKHKVRNVMICGGSRTSIYLAKRLSSIGVHVYLIENDEKKCQELVEILPHQVSVIWGDASDRDLLDSEGLRACDALVTMTGMDEINMVVSMYGANCGVTKVITKLSHEGNNTLLDNLSIGDIICPKELCSESIVQYVKGLEQQTGAALAVHTFADGNAHASEFVVDDNTKNCNVALKNMRLKKNILLVGIKHGTVTTIPNGDSSFEKGDILIIVSSGNEIYKINDIFA